MENIVQETMESYKDYINKIPNGCTIISEYLRQERISEALKLIRNFSEGMAWLVEAKKLLQQNDIKLNHDFEQLTEYLTEINEGLLISDYNLVADIFEYEIIPFFQELS